MINNEINKIIGAIKINSDVQSDVNEFVKNFGEIICVNQIFNDSDRKHYYVEYKDIDENNTDEFFMNIIMIPGNTYIFDFRYGNLIKFKYIFSMLSSMYVASFNGCSNDIGFPAKIGLLNDLLEKINFSDNNFKIMYPFLETIKRDEFDLYISLFLKYYDKQLFEYYRTLDKLDKLDSYYKIEINGELIKDLNIIHIPSLEFKSCFKPDNIEQLFSNNEKDFNVQIFEFSSDNIEKKFDTEGFGIEINETIYIIDYQNIHYWKINNKLLIEDAELIDVKIKNINFVRLINELEDEIKRLKELNTLDDNLINDTKEKIKKLILTVIVFLEIDSSQLSRFENNLESIVYNIEEIILNYLAQNDKLSTTMKTKLINITY